MIDAVTIRSNHYATLGKSVVVNGIVGTLEVYTIAAICYGRILYKVVRARTKDDAFVAVEHRAVLNQGIRHSIEKDAISAEANFKVFNGHMSAIHEDNLTSIVDCLVGFVDQEDEGFAVYSVIDKDIPSEFI